MKRTPLNRKTRLQRRPPIARKPERPGPCTRCGEFTFRLDRHHLVPRARGGSDDRSNIALLCRWCHRLIHDHLVPDWRDWIKTKRKG